MRSTLLHKMAFNVIRNVTSAGKRIKLPSLLIRQYNQHPDCNEIIGLRDVVGYGQNSEHIYIDNPAFPFPAIRFREATPDILALREKEKGDWRNLTIEEKRILYRASFCQTYAEFTAPSGKWKSIVGVILMLVSSGLWIFLIQRWLCNTPLPDSYCESRQKAQLQRILDLEMNPVEGIASKWDYKRNNWK